MEYSLLYPAILRIIAAGKVVLFKSPGDAESFLRDLEAQYGAIFIDLTKAFDMVDHFMLLDKLYAIGFSKLSVMWFNSYLHCRRQRVSFHGCVSQSLIMEKGVPRGSSLGPLQFSSFINDHPLICSLLYSSICSDLHIKSVCLEDSILIAI